MEGENDYLDANFDTFHWRRTRKTIRVEILDSNLAVQGVFNTNRPNFLLVEERTNTNLTITNPNGMGVSGWTNEMGSGTLQAGLYGTDEFVGWNSSLDSASYQDIAIPSNLHTMVDTGNFDAFLSFLQSSPANEDLGRIELICLDGANMAIATFESPTTSYADYTEVFVSGQMPTGTRALRIRMVGINQHSVGAIRVFFTEFQLSVAPASPRTLNWNVCQVSEQVGPGRCAEFRNVPVLLSDPALEIIPEEITPETPIDREGSYDKDPHTIMTTRPTSNAII